MKRGWLDQMHLNSRTVLDLGRIKAGVGGPQGLLGVIRNGQRTDSAHHRAGEVVRFTKEARVYLGGACNGRIISVGVGRLAGYYRVELKGRRYEAVTVHERAIKK